MSTEPPPWDEQRAQDMIGARVIIGITYANPEGTRQEQMFGTVASAHVKDGFEIRLEGARAGGVYWLPPDLRAFRTAPPGEYRLRSTGEVVIDPDYTSSWTINKPLN